MLDPPARPNSPQITQKNSPVFAASQQEFLNREIEMKFL
jgi:hypothetical protein